MNGKKIKIFSPRTPENQQLRVPTPCPPVRFLEYPKTAARYVYQGYTPARANLSGTRAPRDENPAAHLIPPQGRATNRHYPCPSLQICGSNLTHFCSASLPRLAGAAHLLHPFA